MLLKKLILHGFKSFAQRTEINFADGITSIVGPNGCGKSNVIDAVRWVLGEQRARILRSEKMQNVIFNGTAKKRALGMAEVSLVIENTKNILPTEYSEITITRRLYRSGDSEYLLNGVTCLLRDIIDLFMDTGMGANAYSIIELKMIEEILSENTQDRQRLFEEAAGITKYKVRRTQALKKLDTTQHDLMRVKDLMDELEKRVQSLARQASKAKRYKKLKEAVHLLEFQIAQFEYNHLLTQQKELSYKLAHFTQNLESLQATLSVQEANIEAKRVALLKLEQALSQAQQQFNAQTETVQKVETRIQLAQTNSKNVLASIQTLQQAQENAQTQKENLKRRIEILAENKEEASQQVAHLKEVRSHATTAQQEAHATFETARALLSEIRIQEKQQFQVLNEKQQELNRLISRKEYQQEELERLQAQLLKEPITEASETKIKLEQALKEAQQKLEKQQKHLLETETTLTTEKEHVETLKNHLHQLEKKREALSTEIRLLESMVNSFEDYSEAVQFLAKSKQWTSSAPLTVSDLLGCDEKYQVALEVALGQFASCFVVSSVSEAQKAINLLRQNNKGRAAFFVLDAIKPTHAKTVEIPSALPALVTLRLKDKKYQPLADLLFQQTYFVNTLDDANRLANQYASENLKFIALSGEWVDTLGTITGGSKPIQNPNTLRLNRREQLDALNIEQESLLHQIASIHQQLSVKKTQVDKLDIKPIGIALDQAKNAVFQATKMLEKHEYEVATHQQQRTQQEKRIATLNNEITEASAKSANLKQETLQLESTYQVLSEKLQHSQEEYNDTENKRLEANQAYNLANLDFVRADNHFTSLKNDYKRLKQTIEHITAQSEERAESLSQKAEEVALLKIEVEKHQQEHTTQLESYHTTKSHVQQIEADANIQKNEITTLEQQTREKRRERDELQRSESSLQIKEAEINVRLEELLKYAYEELELELSEDAEEIPTDFDIKQSRIQLTELRQKIRGMGAINELALETYEEESERLQFVSGQLQDLVTAEETLLETIEAINQTATKKFKETFEEINQHFSALFTSLFNEGDTAYLALEGDDLLEASIQIIAKPRGKKPSTIAQLSGGEKTLTAIALLFAIYLVKPSPFCILDEVDAPLDDANIDRFMRLIRDFSTSTQFILVTHNKLTMEAADRMYGITMQEQGVSKLVSVTFDAEVRLAS